MKKFMLFTLMTLFCMTLFAEKVYRSDGTFFEMKRNGNVFAAKIDAASLKAPENYKMKWVSGNEFIVIDKHQQGNLPVYLVGMNIVVADSKLFYQGTRSIEFIEKKYSVKATEIMSGYNLIEFDGAADSVKTAQQIVENGDGFAFPNLYRRYELKAVNPVKFPIKDKYYTENYQWSLKNTGKAIGVYGDEIETLKNADVRFEEAMEFIHDQIEEGNLEGFDEKTKVAIMDSGVDFNHPDLKNKLEDGFNMVHEGETGNPGKYDPNDPNNAMYGSSGYSHGTNCAGVAAAEGNEIGTVGICPWCGIYPVTYMEGGMGTVESSSDKKLMEVYTKYAEDPEIVAINCSFGPMAGFGEIPASEGEIKSHKKFMEEGRNGKGGVIVYASGNDGVDASYTGILSYKFNMKRGEDCSFKEGVEDGEDCEEVTSSVVTVGASSGWDTRVTYSNYGDMLDIVAPSLSMRPTLGIATSYLTGYGDMKDKDYTNQFSGTSSATPVITGAFGVIFSVNPELTLEEAVEILHKSADKVNPETGFYKKDGHSVKYGYGRLNLLKAVRLAMGLDMCEASTDEKGDNIDNNCDGKVDEGLNKDISKVAEKCSQDKDCETADFKGGDAACVSGTYNKYNFKEGYCVVKNDNFTCPDGTAPIGDYDSECLLECNNENPCPKGFACTDKMLGKCVPECKDDTDCDESKAHCDTKTKLCQNNPSEPMGPCETTEDCKYGAMMCLTEIPDGICIIMCNNDDRCNDEEDGPNKCAEVNFGGYDMNLCLPGCEDDSQCRSFGYGYSLICHKQYNGKTNICGMPCENDLDCLDPDDETKCVDSRCVSINEPDEPEDTDTQDSDTVSDEEPADDSDDEMNFDDDQPKEKKKSGGCTITTL
ncbi:S8 family serine peptidase [bacterium]|nr:S8 family serine peptidase [bacterium]